MAAATAPAREIRPGARWWLQAASIVAFLALVMVLDLAWLSQDRLPPQSDSSTHLLHSLLYHSQAAGDPFWERINRSGFHYPPLVYQVTSWAYGWFGVSMWTARISMLPFWWILCLALYALGCRVGGIRAGWVMMIWGAASPWMQHFAHGYFLDFPLAAMTTLAAWALVRAGDFRRVRDALLLGLVLGLGLLTKWTLVFFIGPPLLIMGLVLLWKALPPGGSRPVVTLLLSGLIIVMLLPGAAGFRERLMETAAALPLLPLMLVEAGLLTWLALMVMAGGSGAASSVPRTSSRSRASGGGWKTWLMNPRGPLAGVANFILSLTMMLAIAGPWYFGHLPLLGRMWQVRGWEQSFTRSLGQELVVAATMYPWAWLLVAVGALLILAGRRFANVQAIALAALLLAVLINAHHMLDDNRYFIPLLPGVVMVGLGWMAQARRWRRAIVIITLLVAIWQWFAPLWPWPEPIVRELYSFPNPGELASPPGAAVGPFCLINPDHMGGMVGKGGPGPALMLTLGALPLSLPEPEPFPVDEILQELGSGLAGRNAGSGPVLVLDRLQGAENNLLQARSLEVMARFANSPLEFREADRARLMEGVVYPFPLLLVRPFAVTSEEETRIESRGGWRLVRVYPLPGGGVVKWYDPAPGRRMDLEIGE